MYTIKITHSSEFQIAYVINSLVFFITKKVSKKSKNFKENKPPSQYTYIQQKKITVPT